MSGRRTAFRIAAYEAYLKGETTFRCLGKDNVHIDAYLDDGMKKNAKQNLAKLTELVKKKEAPVSKGVPNRQPIPEKDIEYRPKGDICFIIANGES